MIGTLKTMNELARAVANSSSVIREKLAVETMGGSYSLVGCESKNVDGRNLSSSISKVH
jgi:hypothetical protein